MRRRDFVRVAVVGGAAATAGCAALPRSGPTTDAMTGGPAGAAGLVAALDADVVARLSLPAEPGFPQAFRAAPPIDSARLGVGDVLDVTVWETEGGVFAPMGGQTPIQGVMVEPSGEVFIPFVGGLPAEGATPKLLRARIRDALEPLSLSPEVNIRLREPRSRMIALQGLVAQPGIYPIEPATDRLAQMLASAGGAVEDLERIEVTIERDGAIGRALLADVFEDPALNVALRPEDLVVLAPIRERFIALGASNAQAEIPFPTRPLDLLAAIGAASGLRDFDADATGVFVLRWEDPSLADALLTGPPPEDAPTGPGRPIVYRLDLSQPEAFFVARRFAMRDGDAVFVTNAPITELRKLLSVFTTVLTPVAQSQTIGAGF